MTERRLDLVPNGVDSPGAHVLCERPAASVGEHEYERMLGILVVEVETPVPRSR